MFKSPGDGSIFCGLLSYCTRILNYLKVARLVKFSFDIYKLKLEGKLKFHKVYSDVFLAYDIPFRMSFEEHERNLSDMLKIADKEKCRILVCGYFEVGPVMKDVNNFLLKFTSQRNLPFCDNNRAFEEYRKKFGTSVDLISEDGWHPNIKGYSIIAQNLYEEITRHNLL